MRTVKTASGATEVQIERRDGRRRVGIEHIGSAHDEAELEALKAEARRRMNEGQMVLPALGEKPPAVHTVDSHSRLLYDAVASVYADLGLFEPDDPTFRELVVARVVEPVSKFETVRVMRELGLEPPSYSAMRRCLGRCARLNCCERVQLTLLSRAPAGSLTLLLYNVTTRSSRSSVRTTTGSRDYSRSGVRSPRSRSGSSPAGTASRSRSALSRATAPR